MFLHLFFAALFAQRIVALMPAYVEDVCAIGASRELVGVSAFTSDIPCARGVPVVGDFASVDVEKIIEMHPTAVIGIPAQARLVEPLQRAGIHVELLSDDAYADIFTVLQRIGDLTGHSGEARREAATLHKETAALRARTRGFKRAPSVFVALGSGPIWTVGPQSYIATLIGFAGGRNAVSALPSAYASFSSEALLRLQPDAIVTDPSVRLSGVLDREPWRSLHAVRTHRVFTIPDASLLERPGPRYNDGLRWLIDRLEPIAR